LARPEKTIDWNIVEKRMQANCKASSIAYLFGIHINTFYVRFIQEYGESFCEYLGKMHAVGKENVAFKQYEKAIDEGNVQMLTLLGEEWLGQGRKTTEMEETKYAGTTAIADIGKFCRSQAEPKTDQSDRGSECLDEHLAGGCIIGKDIQQPDMPI